MISKAFTKMIKFKKFQNSILGYIKVFEVPPQKNDKSYFNPHFHCIFAVSTSYFNSKLNLYLNTQDFRELWQKALKVDYLPVVNVKIIKENKKKSLNEIDSAIFEIAKYQLKYTDLKDIDVDVFKNYYFSLKNTRALSFGGIFKEYKQNIKDDEDDLIYIDNETQVKGEIIGEVSYHLKNGRYLII
jgi:plasmid rolling circle replication initiator protein Rep